MAMRLHSGDGDLENIHEINVTPFIDVILVLLIIFMISAPLATVDMAVDLPGSNAEQAQRPANPLFITVKADLSVAVGERSVDRSDLASTVDRETSGNHDQRLFLRADKSVSYGDLMQVMNDLRAAGYLKLALVGLDQASSK